MYILLAAPVAIFHIARVPLRGLVLDVFSQNQLQLTHVHMQIHFHCQLALDPHVYQYISVAARASAIILVSHPIFDAHHLNLVVILDNSHRLEQTL